MHANLRESCDGGVRTFLKMKGLCVVLLGDLWLNYRLKNVIGLMTSAVLLLRGISKGAVPTAWLNGLLALEQQFVKKQTFHSNKQQRTYQHS